MALICPLAIPTVDVLWAVGNNRLALLRKLFEGKDVAIIGTIISFVRLKEHSNVETFCFVGMGLSVLVAFGPLMDSVSPAAVIWLIAEGVSYITGAVFYSFNKTKYMHSVFHFFVLAGSVCHIIAVWDVLMAYL